MSSTYAAPLDRLEAVLDELAAIGPEYRTLAERQEFLLRISKLISRAEAAPSPCARGVRRHRRGDR